MDSGKEHSVTFKPAISFFVSCETQKEINYFWEKLSAGGEKDRCGWLKDKFGVSWQIVPPVLGEFLNDADEEKSERVMKAMLEMDKLDIKALKRARVG
jgi:predicted 3-demethylubiquinone-9 3-methyltransferase (glyoxalase superfamily)